MSEVTEKIKQQLADCPQRTYNSGQIILFADETPPAIFYLESGRVRMYDVTAKGNEVVANIYEPGKFFPLSWALNRTPNRFFFRAELTSKVRLVSSDKALEVITSDPQITIELLGRIFTKLDRIFARMVYLMSASAGRRLTFELLEECRRFGVMQDDGSCIVAVREVDLASRSGLSRETVSREFQKLKERKLVKLEKQGIRVYDTAKLEAEIGAIQ